MPKHIPFEVLPFCLSNASGVSGHGYGHIVHVICGVILGCSFGLTGCGGGGGGGAGTGTKVPVTYDSQPTGTPLSPLIWVTGSDEYEAQSGLADIQVNAAYLRGFSGRDINAGIVDSGIDGTHSEFENRLAGGGDWQADSDGLIDPHGHGTHVAGIVGAMRDDTGIHGVAPEASLYSYRILNNYGYFGSRKGYQMIPELVTNANSDQVMLLNNSWASTTEINDLPKQSISSALGAELDAWKDAVSYGQVMIWAAGNDRDDEVSVRAGLPYYFPELQAGWLAVVSADPNGIEPGYTNRCGVSASWCITAPGGGDSIQNGILSTRNNGDYMRRSGTSMAAPHVTGGLVLVLNAFPQLTPHQAVTRLLQTAGYAGLETADGCTIETCDKAKMQAVFGQGMMNIEAALEPIGSLSVSDGINQFMLDDTMLVASPQLYQPLREVLGGYLLPVRDNFDGAEFTTPLGNMIAQSRTYHAPLSATYPETPSAIYPAYKDGRITSYLSADTTAGALPDRPERLVDMSAGRNEFNAGFVFDDRLAPSDDSAYALRLGYAQKRQSASLSRRWLFGEAQSWFGAGLAQHRHFLDSAGFAGLNTGISAERWIFSGWALDGDSHRLSAESLWGQADMKSSAGLLRSAHANISSMRIAAQVSAAERSTHQLSLSQPLSIESAYFTFAGLREDGTTTLPFSRRTRQLRWEYGFDYAVSHRLNSSMHIHSTQKDISRPGFGNSGVLAQLSWIF